ncbi:MAG: hypothetical protein Kow001_20540 [Acidobacteriota bacterium]
MADTTEVTDDRRTVALLSELPRGAAGVILSVAPAVAGQLVGFGLYPGVTVRVRQTFPSLVIQAEATELALEETLARQIRVETLDSV